MAFNLRLRGLIVCVFESTRLRTLLLNSGFDQSLALPHHVSTLILPKTAVRSSTAAELPSLRGRAPVRELEELEPKVLDENYFGWDLTGLTLAVSGGAGAPTKTGGAITDIHPNPQTPDWSDLHWVMNVEGFLPGASLKTDAFKLGALTSSIVDFTGGTAAGSSPANGGDSNWVYFFSPKATQAVTDTLEWRVYNDFTITLSDAKGGRGEIVIGPDGIGYLMNEASVIDNLREVEVFKCLNKTGTAPVTRHTAAYTRALDQNPAGRTYSPVPLYKFMGTNAYEGTFCIILRA